MTLSSDQFVAYFTALHGYEPFPWQENLAKRVCAKGEWPDLLDIPTGLGKTSAIDIALFVVAARPEIAPRRIVLVVDRRVIVDQAADHARKIQERLHDAQDGVLKSVAEALRSLWEAEADERPFEVAVMRGGMPRDEAWAQRPDRPVVAVSTVDQVGSRLLFRGYGVSPGMAPIHAGLLGHDTLLLLDEVQLSTAFAETLQAVAGRWRDWREAVLPKDTRIPNRWGFVRMSATPVGDPVREERRFELGAEDLSHPLVRDRREASKVAHLADPIPTSKNDSEKSLRDVVKAFCEATEAHLGQAKRIAVIVNRVLTAQHVQASLRERLAERADVVLLTGRMRPLERTALFGSPKDAGTVASRIAAGAPRSPDQRPVVVVATQTIEAGADFDFDALVTECASIDALRQRFGRLDRRGELRETKATILIRKDQAAEGAEDPVYGGALNKTWAWLNVQGGSSKEVNFGIAEFPTLPADLAELCSPITHAPVLLPAHLDAWAETNPRGEPSPDISLWLHGPNRGLPEVRVVWRADLDAAALGELTRDRAVKDYAAASLTAAPPSSLECISIPLHACRAWLVDRLATEVADVEGAQPVDDGPKSNHRACRPYLVVSRKGVKLYRDTSGLFPEVTIVVPATYGGISEGNWNPQSQDPVRDYGDVAQFLHRRKPVLRLVPEVLPPKEGAWVVPVVPQPEDLEFNARDVITAWLDEQREIGSKEWKAVALALLGVESHRSARSRSKFRVIELPPRPVGDEQEERHHFAILGRALSPAAFKRLELDSESTSDIVSDDDDSASFIGQEIGLEEHLRDVARWARDFARNVGLSEELASDLSLAALLHDLGKADPRFQQLLHGGSLVRMAASGRLLAKSKGDFQDQAARQQAQERAGYPSGYRHELMSVAMLEANAEPLRRAHDPELVLHLVGSHHGWCRPFAPALSAGPSLRVQFSFDGVEYVADAAHRLAAVDAAIADRYWQLTQRYGWWTLAWFEALLRLADHRASEEAARRRDPDVQPAARGAKGKD